MHCGIFWKYFVSICKYFMFTCQYMRVIVALFTAYKVASITSIYIGIFHGYIESHFVSILYLHKKCLKNPHHRLKKIMQSYKFYFFRISLHLHHNAKNVGFSQTKDPIFSKMDIYFCPFFRSEPISFSDFYNNVG